MEEFKGDKRSKAYKEWKKNHEAKSEGLGDTVEKITKATGIKKVVDTVFQKLEKSCGCDERKISLNKLFPYQKPLCLMEDEYNYLSDRIGKTNKITSEEQKELLSIYNRIFKEKKELTSCSSCFLNGVWNKLETVYKEYS
tara:strand:+ start:12534 stop:12953 length:420 start_codon:yes stop_codon:yes gene_type:complete